ncbi:MAG: hypothetical protein AABZ24_12465, partial [Nitrospirota bacterium]
RWNDELAGTDSLAGTADDGVLNIGPVIWIPSPENPRGAYTVRVFDNAGSASTLAPHRQSTPSSRRATNCWSRRKKQGRTKACRSSHDLLA